MQVFVSGWEMVPNVHRLMEVGHAISYTEYGLVEVKRAECRWETRPSLQSKLNRSSHIDPAVDGANIVDSFVMRSTIPWKIVVPTDSTTWRANSRGCQRKIVWNNVTLHQAVERSVVDPAGFHANDTWLENTFRLFLYLPFCALLTIGGEEEDTPSFMPSAAARGINFSYYFSKGHFTRIVSMLGLGNEARIASMSRYCRVKLEPLNRKFSLTEFSLF